MGCVPGRTHRRAARATKIKIELLERLEDEEDVEEAEKVLARARAKGEKPIPWDKARKKFGF